jgi:nucleoside-diphosphate-sugar epimerase
MAEGENPLRVWGDGSATRDFIFAEDVAHWMLVAMEKAPPCLPINIGSGIGVSIKELVDIIKGCFPNPPIIEWDLTKPAGDPVRILSIKRAQETLNYHLITDIEKGIGDTIEWYTGNYDFANQKKRRYNDK